MKFSIFTPTHNPLHLEQTWRSIQAKTWTGRWEWIVVCNGSKAHENRKRILAMVQNHSHVRVEVSKNWVVPDSVGLFKKEACDLATGDWLVELDHDDMLTDDALEVLAREIRENPDCGFFYSEVANFSDTSPDRFQGIDHTYMRMGAKEAWEANGWRFVPEQAQSEVRPGKYWYPLAFEPSAASIASILFAPNHVRVWKKSVYDEIGGHNPTLSVCDDHDLLVRTYLRTKMHCIRKLLYLYRCSGLNTWVSRAEEIAKKSREIGLENLERLVLREASLKGLPVYDLGSGPNPRKDWISVDHDRGYTPQVLANLAHPWPFEDSSVFAFRAYDFLEHIADKQHTMSEIHRCLVPGGWLLSSTPSTDGRGAFQDPTHKSFWNQNSFWYWTRDEQARYIGNTEERFSEACLYTHYPTEWHKAHHIPYAVANLIALKAGYAGPKPSP